MGMQSAWVRRNAVVALSVLLALASGAPASHAERPLVFAIEGARVIPAPGQEIAEATIVIRDGLIVDVGPEVTTPPDAVVIEGEGLWVYAGLIDVPIGLVLEDAGQSSPSPRARGGTSGSTRPGAVHPLSRVHPEERAVDRMLPIAGDRKRQVERYRELGFTAGLVAPRSGIFRGSSSVVLLQDDSPVAEIIVADGVAQHLAFEHGSFGEGYPTSLMGAVATQRQVFLDAQRHAAWVERYEADPSGMQRPDSAPPFEALAELLSGDQPAIFHASSPYDVLLADRVADEFGLRALVVASGHEWEIVDQIAAADRALVLPVAFPKKPQVSDDDEALDVSIKELRRYLEAATAAVRLDEAGVEFALTSDGLSTLSDFKKNIGKMIEAGLREDAALAALTTVPAGMLGIERVVGTLEAGKIANLAIFDGPIFDADTTTKRVFVDGVEYRMEEKKKPQGFDPDAVVDPRGEWAVVFDLPGRSIDRLWVINGEGDSLNGTAETRSGTVSFESVRLEGNMLTVVFPAEGSRGAMELTVVITGDSFEGSAEFGPQTVSVTGTRTSGPNGGER